MQFAIKHFLPLLAIRTLAPAQTPLADVQMTLKGVHIFVDVKVNGQGPFPMNIDTGVSGGLAKRVGLASVGEVVMGGAGAGTKMFGKAKGISIRIGEAEISGLAGVIDDDLETVAAGIGADLFRRYTVQFDYDRMRMRLYAKGTVPEIPRVGTVPLRFQADGHKPLVYLCVGKQGGWFMADTGGGVSLILQRNFWRPKRLDRQGRPPIKTIVGYGIGGPIYGRVGRGPTLGLGEVELPGMVVSYSDMTKGSLASPERDGLLGQRILRRFNLTFDYANARLLLEPNREFKKAMPFSRTGLAGLVEGMGFNVDYVIPHSPGARAGLRKGDVVIEADGRMMDEEHARKSFGRSEGTRLPLRVLRGDRMFTAVLLLREVLK